MLPSRTSRTTERQADLAARIRGAWTGRATGCLLGKPVEVLSWEKGLEGLWSYLEQAGPWPLRDYVPLVAGTLIARIGRRCCLGEISRTERDDVINYTLIALTLLEEHGTAFGTADVARAWLNRLPAGATWTVESAACRILLERMNAEFIDGAETGFDLTECSAHEYNGWIGAQIRADLCGWVCPGYPSLAAELVRRAASLSYRGERIDGAVFVAALGAIVPESDRNAATVGGLLGLAALRIGPEWTQPWGGWIGTTLAGATELSLDEVTVPTAAVAERIDAEATEERCP